MCYDVAQLAFRIYKDARRAGASEAELNDLYDKWKLLQQTQENYYHASGFIHPSLFTYSIEDGHFQISKNFWGLIPHWVKDIEQAKEIRNHTINARGETIFEKPSFRESAAHHRSILPLDGFYEHHYLNNKSYPFYIRRKDGQAMFVAALNAEWLNKETGEIFPTVSMVTTVGNKLLSQIHNNPKLEGPRMPLVLNDDEAKIWMSGSQQDALELIHPHEDVLLEAHAVRRIRGKEYIGNIPEVQDSFDYEELVFE